jgi:uncharacterized pyridoxal phosphate-containing UPF0001 family protein
MTLKEKFNKIKENIFLIQKNAGFNKEVEIVAVTKTHPFQTIRDSWSAGFLSIGENRIQEAVNKFESFDSMPNLKKDL